MSWKRHWDYQLTWMCMYSFALHIIIPKAAGDSAQSCSTTSARLSEKTFKKRGKQIHKRCQRASGAVALVVSVPSFSSPAEAIYQRKRKPLHMQLLSHKKHERNLCTISNVQQCHCCNFENPTIHVAFLHVKFKMVCHSNPFENFFSRLKYRSYMLQWFKPLFTDCPGVISLKPQTQQTKLSGISVPDLDQVSHILGP